jgi:hypothetical protein
MIALLMEIFRVVVALWHFGNTWTRRIARLILFWPLFLFSLAYLLPRESALFWLPLVGLLPLVGTLYLLTELPLFTGAVALFGKGRKIISILFAISAISILFGIVLGGIPWANDRNMIPLAFALLVLSFFPIGRAKKWVVFALVIIAAIILLGGRIQATDIFSKANQQTAIAPVHSDIVCQDTAGHRKELHYESFLRTDFDESFQAGCATLIAMPHKWGYHWQIQPATDEHNTHPYIYVKEPGEKYRGPYDVASDVNMHLMSLVFYIQPTEDVKIHFWTDLVLQ